MTSELLFIHFQNQMIISINDPRSHSKEPEFTKSFGMLIPEQAERKTYGHSVRHDDVLIRLKTYTYTYINQEVDKKYHEFLFHTCPDNILDFCVPLTRNSE
ncbi:hypothetical protein Mapa_007313 [Marchantia paleacea]|nr:hypothetical protein Mapa_007313 [Marchantia paleacea]